MATTRYLAMTAWEFAAAEQLPPKAAWMVCQAPDELSNPPAELPMGSVLILNDQFPLQDQELLSRLPQTVNALGCSALLLDFQRPDIPEQTALALQLAEELPCPVAVSDLYARDMDCPVFLSPCPHHVHLQEHIQPWQGRELWLDLAADAETILLTPQGAAISFLPVSQPLQAGHWDKQLHCHYLAETTTDQAKFTLWRTREDLEDLAAEAEAMGIHTFVGLYSELG